MQDVRLAFKCNSSRDACSDGHDHFCVRCAAPEGSGDGFVLAAAVCNTAAGHCDINIVPFLEQRFGIVALTLDLPPVQTSNMELRMKNEIAPPQPSHPEKKHHQREKPLE
jgi:hypothetical protein